MSLLRSWGCAHVAHSGPGDIVFLRAVFRGGVGAGRLALGHADPDTREQAATSTTRYSFCGEAVNAATNPPRCRGRLGFSRGTPRDKQPRHPHHVRRTHRTTSSHATPATMRNKSIPRCTTTKYRCINHVNPVNTVQSGDLHPGL
jgi:hypothetical protein